MKHTYKITGMTCNGCRSHVEKILSKVEGVAKASVDLEKAEATIEMESHIKLETFQEAFFDFGTFAIWFFWGIGIVFQGLNTFGLNLVFSKGWQDRKVREFMNDK